jgi:hypothetical protein
MNSTLTHQQSILTAAVLSLFLAFSQGVPAAPPEKCDPWPSCKGGDDPPADTEIQFHVEVVTDSANDNPWSPDPGTCAAYTIPGDTSFRARFARHLQCAPECWLYLDQTDEFLTDDIFLNLSVKKGTIQGFELSGQDTIGREGIMHESDTVNLDVPVPDNPELGFDQLSGHLAGRRVQTAGVIQIGKLVYTPCEEGTALPCPASWPVEYPDYPGCPE